MHVPAFAAATMRRLVAIAPLAALASIACTAIACTASKPAAISDETFEIDCRSVACAWTIVEGHPRYGDGWTEGDVAVDLSGDERAVVEQRDVLLSQTTRQLLFEAAIVRDPSSTLRFEIDWYAAGQGSGKTFWDRAPVLLDRTTLPIWEEGVNRVRRSVLVPSESAALVLRIVKEGSGATLVGELTLGRFPQGLVGEAP